MASTTPRGVVHHILPIISRSPESLDANYLSYNNVPSYSYAPNVSGRMHTINIPQHERSQSTHKVPKRRRLAPSWNVVNDRPPHQLVHGVRARFQWTANGQSVLGRCSMVHWTNPQVLQYTCFMVVFQRFSYSFFFMEQYKFHPWMYTALLHIQRPYRQPWELSTFSISLDIL